MKWLKFLVAYATANSCSINIKEYEVEPVHLVSEDNGDSYQFFIADNTTTNVQEGTQLLLLCPGRSNKIKNLGKENIELTCNNGEFQDDAGKKHLLKDLQCGSIPTADMRETDKSCADGNGNIYEAGFSYKDDQFATLFIVCYNKEDKTVYYTHHVLHGKCLPYAISESKRRAFRADGMGETTTKINKLYTTNQQISHFEKLYGKSQTYVSQKCFLARGHLVPDADGCLRYEQLGTYFYINAQAEFQDVNAGNWLHVESLTRTAASKLNTDLDIYTGAFGDLIFEDNNGKSVKAYLDEEKKMGVPLFYFKIVLSPRTSSGIVFISVNNPHINEFKPFCSSVCEKSNLYHKNFSTAKNGLTFCCTVDEFRKHYQYIPDSVHAKNLLTV